MSQQIALIARVKRRPGVDQGLRAGSVSPDLSARIEALFGPEQHDGPVIGRECRGGCETGPVIRCARGAPFYSEIDATLVTDIAARIKPSIKSRHADLS